MNGNVSNYITRISHIAEWTDNLRRVIAVIPALDEEKTIESVVRGSLKHVDQVIVVDDASSDNTTELARKVGAFVLRLKRRKRLGGVIQVGLEYAKKLAPDVLVILDGDGQHDPDDIPRLMSPILDGRCHWVIGSRFLTRSPEKSSKTNNIGRRFFSYVVNLLAGEKITDVMSGFRALGKEALLNLDIKFEYGSSPEMTLVLCLENYQFIEVPIQDKPRLHGRTRCVNNKVPYVLKQLGILAYTFLRFKVCKGVLQ